MRKILLFLLFSIAIKVFAQTSQDEVVYLKNGSIIRGTIIEQIPNEKIKIQTSEGNVFVYKYDEIEKITKEPKIINPNAYQSNTNNFSDEVKHHKSKGIACIVTGATFFAVGMPFMLQGLRTRNSYYGGILLGRFIPGTILVATSIPLIIVGPVQLGKYSKLKKEEGNHTGLFISPSIGIRDNTGITSYSKSKGISVGATLTFKFWFLKYISDLKSITMKKVLLFLLICLSFNVFAQSSLEEVVYLKNGSIIRGTIIEQIPNVKIKIQTSEGNVFVYKYDEIEKITKEPQYLVSPNATNNNTVSDEIKSHKAKGIALTVTGGTIFSIGFPIMILGIGAGAGGAFISGTILTAASIPMIILGPIHLSKYHNLKNQSNSQTGFYLSPSFGVHDKFNQTNGIKNNSGISSFNNSKGISLGATLTFKFWFK